LWEAIEREPEEFAEHALEWPLDQLTHFLDTAREHDREIDPLCEAIEKRPQKLSTTAKESSLSALSGFCRSAPTNLIGIALADFQTDRWDGFSSSNRWSARPGWHPRAQVSAGRI
jgi:hypothetical protein